MTIKKVPKQCKHVIALEASSKGKNLTYSDIEEAMKPLHQNINAEGDNDIVVYNEDEVVLTTAV